MLAKYPDWVRHSKLFKGAIAVVLKKHKWWRRLMKNETDSAEGRKDGDILSNNPREAEGVLADEKDIEKIEKVESSYDSASQEELSTREPWRVKLESKRNSSEKSEVDILDEDNEENEEDYDESDHDERQLDTDALGFDDGDDPLGDAYDLEHGDVLKPTEVEVRHAPWKSKISTPREFFGTEVLYRHDILEDADRELLRGRYRIELKGAQGGIWSLSLGDQIEVVNRVEEADVVISMQQKDFLDLVNGALNPQLAILAKKIKIQGDVRRAIYFQSMLAPNVD